MARLNEAAAPGGNVNFMALKQRWAVTNKANEEFARANAQQAIRIRALESENSRLLEENLTLHRTMIHMQVQLDGRDKSRTFADNVAATQRKLQEKVAEVNELLKELEMPKEKERRSTQAVTLESRQMRDTSTTGEMPPGMLPSISEDARSRRNSIQTESRRRNSFNFDDVQLPPQPTQLSADMCTSDNDTEDAENFLETRRPRRRRDSSAVSDLEPKKQPARQKFVEQEPSPEPSPPSAEEDLDFRFSRVAQRAANNARRQVEIEKIRNITLDDHQDAPMVEDIVMEDVLDERAPSPTQEKQERRHVRGGSIQRSINSGNTTAVRKALGPKNTNSDFAVSPMKLGLKDEKPLSTPLLDEKAIKPTTVRNLREKDTPPPDTDPASTVASSTGRTARRARSQVSYAEPSLRVKMRREDTKLVDAVTGEGKTRRAGSMSGAGATPSSTGAPTPDPSARKLSAATPTPLFNIKSEPSDEVEDQHVWLRQPMLSADQIQGHQEDPMKSSADSSEQLPSSIATHRGADRRRRTSGLLSDVLSSSAEKEDDANGTRPQNLRRTSLSNALDAARIEAREAREARERQREREREVREKERAEREKQREAEERPDSAGSSGSSTTTRSEDKEREKKEREDAARARIEERRKAYRRTTIHVATDGEGEVGKENAGRKVVKTRSTGNALERSTSLRERDGQENEGEKTTAAERMATRRRSMVV